MSLGVARVLLIAPLALETVMLVLPTFGQAQNVRLVALPEDRPLSTPTLDVEGSSCTTTPVREPS